ncbi:MAG: hypothetical protein ACJA0S_000489 [Rickettsiales bacterium]|jgi:hypothetical protein
MKKSGNPLDIFRDSIGGENPLDLMKVRMGNCIDFFNLEENKTEKHLFLYDCLKRSCHFGDKDIVKLLLSQGTQSDNRGGGSDHPVNRAIIGGYEDLALFLIKESGFVRKSSLLLINSSGLEVTKLKSFSDSLEDWGNNFRTIFFKDREDIFHQDLSQSSASSAKRTKPSFVPEKMEHPAELSNLFPINNPSSLFRCHF